MFKRFSCSNVKNKNPNLQGSDFDYVVEMRGIEPLTS